MLTVRWRWPDWSAGDRKVAAEAARDGLGDDIDFSVVTDGSCRGDFEGGPAQCGGVGAYNQADADWCGVACRARIGIDVEDIDPVGGLGGMVIEQPECPVGLLVKVWSAEERLPGVPHRLWQSECHSPAGTRPPCVEMFGPSILRPAHSGYLVEPVTVQVEGAGQSRYRVLIAAVRVGGLKLDHTVLADAEILLVEVGQGAARRDWR